MRITESDMKSPTQLSESIAKIIAEKQGITKKRSWKRRISDLLTYDKEDKEKFPRLWKMWRNMFQRTIGTKNNNQHHYKDIRVCDAWRDFKWFSIFALTHGYEEEGDLSIDRIDNEDNYKPSNCRFVDQSTQQRNKSNNFYVDYCGEKFLLIELCEKFDMPYSTVYSRIRIGWSVDRALTTPIRKKAKKGEK